MGVKSSDFRWNSSEEEEEAGEEEGTRAVEAAVEDFFSFFSFFLSLTDAMVGAGDVAAGLRVHGRGGARAKAECDGECFAVGAGVARCGGDAMCRVGTAGMR